MGALSDEQVLLGHEQWLCGSSKYPACLECLEILYSVELTRIFY